MVKHYKVTAGAIQSCSVIALLKIPPSSVNTQHDSTLLLPICDQAHEIKVSPSFLDECIEQYREQAAKLLSARV